MANRKHYDFEQMVISGYLADHSHNHKFGAAPSISINSTSSIWDVSDTLYPWTALDTPAVVNIERNNAADSGLIITVQGLDENWKQQSEDITITGADQVGTKLWRRVNRAFVKSGAALVNVGNIDIEAGTAGGTTIARITANLGQTLMAVYTIPAGYIGYLYQGAMTIQNGGDATGYMFVRRNALGNIFRIGHTFEVTSGSPYKYQFSFPPALPEKSDIDVRAMVRSNNSRVTAVFDILLVENDPEAPITDLL